MKTRRIALGSVAGLMSAFLALGSLGLPGAAQAQQPTTPPSAPPAATTPPSAPPSTEVTKPPARRQPTKSGIKARARAGAKRAHLKWDSLTPEQQEHLKQDFKATADKAQEKWDSMTAEQQQRFIAKARKGSAKTRAWWKTLPE